MGSRPLLERVVDPTWMGEPSVSKRRSCSAVARLPAWLSSYWSRVSKSSIDRSNGTVICRVMPSGEELTTWAAMA